MIGTYTFLPREKVIFGPGSVSQLADEVERLGGRRAFVITGHTLATQTPLIERVAGLLETRHAGTYAGVSQHVPESDIAAAAEQARTAAADLLVSVGGGSPIDGAKSVAWALRANGTPLLQIAVPTTLSAAEYSGVAGFTVESDRTKSRISDPRLVPGVVILDPEMTLDTPSWLWSSSGIRALDHAVETLYAPGLHPVQDVLALQAIEDLFVALPAARQHPSNLEVRLRCQLAAWMSFFAPATIRYGLSHTLSKAFGTTFAVPHGITSCITLPPVMRRMAATHAAALAQVARRLSVATAETSPREAALAAANAVASLIERLELPSRLRDVDVPREALEQIAIKAVGHSPQQAEVLGILEQAW